jgi:hypothetical protein
MDHTTILAIDFGKFNSVACWFKPETRSAAFRATRNGDAELRRALLYQPVAQVASEARSPVRRPITPRVLAQSSMRCYHLSDFGKTGDRN